MPNEDTRNNPPTDAQAHPTPQSPMAPSAPQQNEVRKYSDSRPSDENNKTIQLEQDIRSGERWLIGISAAGVILNIVIALIYYGQLGQMRKATIETGRASDAAGKANELADKGIKQNLENSRLDQRAWVGIENIRAIPDVPETGKTFDVIAAIRNSGKTPAKNILMEHGANVFSGTPKVNDMCLMALKRQESRTILPPNGGFTSNLRMNKDKPLEVGWEQALKDKKIYSYGCLLYEDISGKSHWVTYCGWLDIPTKGFKACRLYNDTGDGDPPK